MDELEQKFQTATAEREVAGAVISATDKTGIVGWSLYFNIHKIDPSGRQVPLCESVRIALCGARRQASRPRRHFLDSLFHEADDRRGCAAMRGTGTGLARRRYKPCATRMERSRSVRGFRDGYGEADCAESSEQDHLEVRFGQCDVQSVTLTLTVLDSQDANDPFEWSRV